MKGEYEAGGCDTVSCTPRFEPLQFFSLLEL